MTQRAYARVSSTDQNLSRQIDALREWGIEEKYLYMDKASGKDFERPAYKKLIKSLRRGDTLVVKSIDRLGRNYEEIIEEWRHITRIKECDIVVLDQPILDTRKEVAGITGVLLTDILLELLSYVAHVERENIKERQREGIVAARARGTHMGRPSKRPADWGDIKALIMNGSISKKHAASIIKVHPKTVDRWIRQEL